MKGRVSLVLFGNCGMSYADIILAFLLVVCCYTDLRVQKIYNALLLPVVLGAFAVNVYNLGIEGLLYSLKGLLLGMALLIIPFIAGGIGAGDVKLLGAVGALKGTEFVLIVFLAGAICGGLISALLLIRQKKLIITIKKIFYALVNKILNIPVAVNFNTLEAAAKGESIPYAIAIGMGVILAYMLG